MNNTPRVDLRRSEARTETNLSWLRGRHSFWIGGQPHDPNNTHHGLLLVHNEDIIRPGTGFETHPHRDMEIVTWVLEGALVHQDSVGHSGVIYPGLAQRMSAGTGIRHSEKNDSWRLGGQPHTNPVHLIQMWVVPDETGIAPGYEQLEIDHELLSGGLVTVASGMATHDGATAIRIRNRHAAMHAARPRPGQPAHLPEAPVPAPVRHPRHRRPRRDRRAVRRRRRPLHRQRWPTNHGHRTCRNPRLGDERGPRELSRHRGHDAVRSEIVQHGSDSGTGMRSRPESDGLTSGRELAHEPVRLPEMGPEQWDRGSRSDNYGPHSWRNKHCPPSLAGGVHLYRSLWPCSVAATWFELQAEKAAKTMIDFDRER